MVKEDFMSGTNTRRVRRGTLGASAGLLALGLTVLSALPASAAGIHPSGALRNAEGATNGCTVTIPTITVGNFTFAGDVYYGWTVETDLNCPTSAGVERWGADEGIWQVKHDGTLKEIRPLPGKLTNIGHGGPALTGGSIAVQSVCTPGTTLTLMVKGKARTMVVERDPDPFSRTVSWQQTIHC
jgi:hypothetical protein